MEQIRLQKYLADAGIASRRKAEVLIKQGKVYVNGKIVNELGTKVTPNVDEIRYEGKKVEIEEKYIYILLNKPIGYVTTVKEQFSRDKVTDLVHVKERLVPVGRLDMYTSGALILTNDGDFVYKVTHPKNEVTKTYTVTLKGQVSDDEIEKLRNGVVLDDGFKTSPAKVKRIMEDKENNKTRLEIVIHEGKNREVRRMCDAIGKKVLALHRSKIGTISLEGLTIGKWRYLKDDEVQKLLKWKVKW